MYSSIFQWIFILFAAKLCFCNTVTIRKCCASSELYNFSRKLCVLNKNNLNFTVPKIHLDHNETNWQIKDEDFDVTEQSDFCEGKVHRDDRYKVTQTGKLVKYTQGNKTHYEYFNDFCLEADSETGENIAIICKNWENLKKCCQLDHNFIKSNGIFECHKNAAINFHNDVTDFYFSNYVRKPNIKFSILEENDFKNYKVIEEFAGFDPFKEFEGFCLEKIDGKWTKFLKIREIGTRSLNISAILSVIGLISTLFTVIIYLRSNKSHQTNIRILVLYAFALITVSIFNILIKYCNLLFFLFWKDMILGLSFYVLNSIWLETVFGISSEKTTCLNFIGKLLTAIPGFVIIFMIIFYLQHEIGAFFNILTQLNKELYWLFFIYFQNLQTFCF
jgi:hypothetical protein